MSSHSYFRHESVNIRMLNSTISIYYNFANSKIQSRICMALTSVIVFVFLNQIAFTRIFYFFCTFHRFTTSQYVLYSILFLFVQQAINQLTWQNYLNICSKHSYNLSRSLWANQLCIEFQLQDYNYCTQNLKYKINNIRVKIQIADRLFALHYYFFEVKLISLTNEF